MQVASFSRPCGNCEICFITDSHSEKHYSYFPIYRKDWGSGAGQWAACQVASQVT